ncbi:MAG: hypothetical protein LCH66_12505 [Actinobacteria bacterium]|jgi:hypothetical protein|nr:hypothetical protein [Actinomycetota bacterium]
MSMNALVALVAEEGGHEALPMPPLSYGLIALVLFALLLGVTWTFRNNHQKHVPPAEGHGHGESGAVERHH